MRLLFLYGGFIIYSIIQHVPQFTKCTCEGTMFRDAKYFEISNVKESEPEWLFINDGWLNIIHTTAI